MEMTKTDYWEDIKRLENIFYIINIFVLIIITILNHLNIVSDKVLMSAVSIVLSATILLLGIFHNSVRKFQEQCKSPGIGNIFKPFHEMRDEIKLSIMNADEIWLLTRTGQRFVNETFKDQFDYIIKRDKKVCFLFLNPDDDALKMVAKPLGRNSINEKKSAEVFLNELKSRYNNNTINLNVIDYLSAWTLIIINPNKKIRESVIYVELATYHADAEDRPTFKVASDQEKYFKKFIREFEEMWKASSQW